ncbi:MAG: Crp/Fnr family transcriptional regulator [Ekhidna sp.]
MQNRAARGGAAFCFLLQIHFLLQPLACYYKHIDSRKALRELSPVEELASVVAIGLISIPNRQIQLTSEVKSIFDSNFGKYISISNEAYSFLSENFVEMSYPQRSFLVEGGATARYFYFALSGVQAGYLLNNKGEKVIFGFSYQGSPSGIYDSFVTQTPSAYFMEALTDSRLIAISKEKYDALFTLFPEFYRWRTHFIEAILFGRGSREVEMLTLTAKERFDAFIKRCPNELLQIPQKYLASYLNMTPETFSRLRAMRD